ncbi:MAG TPA: XrtA/PEP-CTERM system TPR-repeat protein PrsT [Stellaceae bacterium]|nr:XrtA/PEP-CTERM system TPR-repeat protein PrsT [Stellaceae bacterium]
MRAVLVFGLALLPFLAGAPTVRAAFESNTFQDDLSEAIRLENAGDLRGALERLRKGAALYERNWNLRVELARVYLALGNSPASEIEARNAQRAGAPEDAVAPVLAQALLQESKLSLLITNIAPGTRDPKSEALVRASLGIARLQLGQQDAGEALLRDAQRLDPNAEMTKLGTAQMLLYRGDIAGAEKAFATARAADPQGIDMLRFEVNLRRVKGDLPGALAVLDKILGPNPDDLSALTMRGAILIAQGKLEDADTTLDHALDVAPESIAPNFLKAVVATRTNKIKLADEILTAISQYFSSIPNGYYLQGVVKFALGQYAEALDALTKFIARRPEHIGARIIVAAISLNTHDPGRAISVLSPVIDRNLGNRQAVALLANAYAMAGQRDNMVDLYEHAAAARPSDPRAQVEAALMRVQNGETEVGVSALEKIAATPEGVDIAGPVLTIGELQNGDVDKAAATAEGLVKKNGKDLVAQNLLGGVRLAQLRFADAETIFQSIVAADPNFRAARMNLARTYVAMGQPREAVKVLRDLVAQEPKDIGAKITLAGTLDTMGDHDKAAEVLQSAIAAAPSDDPAPAFALVQHFATQKQWPEALAAQKDLEGRFPADRKVIELGASVRAESGDLIGAAEEYRPLTQQFPRSPEVWLTYSSYQFHAGDKENARVSAKTALAVAPLDATAMTALVELDADTGGTDAALETAQSFQPVDPVASAMLTANVLVKAKRNDEAIAVLTKSQRIYPAQATLRRLAELTYAAGRHEEAEKMLRSWLAAHDDASTARMALGNMLLLDHDYGGAQAVYERAFKDMPHDPIVLDNLAWLYARKNDPRARDFALRALRAAPDDHSADTLGWVLVKDGEAGTGLLYLRQAAAGMPKDLAVQYHLAAALKATGDAKGALALLERVLQSGTDFDGRDDARRLFDSLRGG